MEYNDIQIRAFTQIAYKISKEKFEKLSVPEGTPVKLNKLLSTDYLKSIGLTDDEINSWEIPAVHDTNVINGFSACVIQTAPGEAAVGFRGSEDMKSYSNVKDDWVEADLKLLNSTCTRQQAEVDIFLKENKDLLNKYDNLTMTGHSLGGNLAEYATIVSGRYGLDDNISQCVSLDGPGFSDEFIREHPEIKKMSGKMKHYRWSFVGALLNDLPGVEYEFLSVSNEANTMDGDEYTDFTRHDTKYLVIDESTGKFVRGEQDDFSKTTSIISKGIDHMPRLVGDALVTVIGGIWISAAWAKERMFDENKNLTATGYAIIAGAAVVIGALGVGTVITVAATTVVVLISVIIDAFLYELVYEAVCNVISAICNAVEKIYNWAKETIGQLYQSAIDLVNGIKEWFDKNFNAGYRYSNENPQIRLDTYKLREYANRISRVNWRLSDIDRRIDSLYWHAGLADIVRLMYADTRIGYSWQLQRCEEYLNCTASDFEEAEFKIINA